MPSACGGRFCETDTATTTLNVRRAWSLLAMLASASCTVTVTVLSPSVVGVPHTVRAAMQAPAPSSSKTRPGGRPATV